MLRILLTVTDRIKSLLFRVFLSCLFILLQEVTLYSLLVVGYKSQVDLLLFLLVAFDVTYSCKDSVGIFFRSLGFGFRPTSAFASATALVVTQGYFYSPLPLPLTLLFSRVFLHKCFAQITL